MERKQYDLKGMFEHVVSCYIKQSNADLPDETLSIIISFLGGLDVDSGLMGHWTFDHIENGEGSVPIFRDYSSNHNHITLDDNDSEYLFVPKEQCIHLSPFTKPQLRIKSVNDCLDCASYQSNDLTVGIWVNGMGKCDGPMVAYRGRNGPQDGWNFHFWLMDHCYFSRVCYPGRLGKALPEGIVVSNNHIRRGQWVFVVTTYNSQSGIQKMYLDGECKATVKVGNILPIGTDGDIVMGEFVERGLDAKLKGLQIYHRCLSEQEVRFCQML